MDSVRGAASALLAALGDLRDDTGTPLFEPNPECVNPVCQAMARLQEELKRHRPKAKKA